MYVRIAFCLYFCGQFESSTCEEKKLLYYMVLFYVASTRRVIVLYYNIYNFVINESFYAYKTCNRDGLSVHREKNA